MVQIKKYFTKTLVVSVLTGVFIFLFCKFFVIDLIRVDSMSMSATLNPNSFVFVRPLTFLAPGININDIVEIEYPFTKNDTIAQNIFLKRVVALPGDTINIRESILYVNRKELAMNTDLIHNYVIKLKQQKDTALFEEEKILEKYLVDDSCVYIVTLTNVRFLEIKNKGVSIQENKEDSGLYDENIFPNYATIKWNKDFFGPLYIPKKNDTIRLDTSTIALYKKLLVDFENNTLEIKGDTFYVNQTQVTYYITKQNYYFAIGDNFDNSIDARHWGFIPQKAIRAKVLKP